MTDTDQTRRAIRAEFEQMPFGGTAYGGMSYTSSTGITDNEILDRLIRLRDTLNRHNPRRQVDENRELSELRRDVMAMRRLMGTDHD